MKRPLIFAATFTPFAPLLAQETPTLSPTGKPASAITFANRGAVQQPRRAAPVLLISSPTAEPAPIRIDAISKAAPAPVGVPILTAKMPTETVASPAKPRAIALRSPKPVLAASVPDSASREVSAKVLVPVAQIALLRKTPEKRASVQLASVPRLTPSTLASRRAIQQRMMLAALDADLAKAEKRLQRSETRLTEGQRQLGSINNLLQDALLDTSEDGRGLHPFVRVSQRYLGTPYVWGGESARGFDCSGFIMRVMRDLGYKALPHSAAEQFNYGTPISRGLLKPGDIVFFANTYKRGVSHVGIYLGRGRFIHAANSKQGTIVSGLNEPKWVQHYAGARRLVRVGS